MRNARPLFAVALSLALTPPASSALLAPHPPAPSAPVAFSPADWEAVIPTTPNPAVDAAVKKACSGGTLAIPKSAENDWSHYLCVKAGYNCGLYLYCVQPAGTTASPIDVSILDLTVYGPLRAKNQYVLNRGRVRNSPDVAVRAFGAAGAPPATGAEASHGAALDVQEKGWLAPDELSDYQRAIGATPPPAAPDLEKIYKKARASVAANLRDEARAPYQKLVDEGKFDEIESFLAAVKHWSGPETQLSPEETAALASVLKSASGAGAGLTLANARLDYEAAMAPHLGANGAPKRGDHVPAHRIVLKYRPMVPAKPGAKPNDATNPAAGAGAAPGQTAGGSGSAAIGPLSDDELRRIGEPASTAYKKEIADAGKDPDKLAAVYKKYRDYLAFKGMPRDAALNVCKNLPKTQVAAQTTRADCKITDSTMNACKEKFPSPTPPVGTSPEEIGKLQKDQQAKLVDCEQAADCAQSGVVAAPAGGGYPEPYASDCKALAAGGTSPTTPNTGNMQGPQVPAPGGPGTHAGTDSDPAGNPPKKAEDKNFYGNLGNATGFALGGLLLGSFFGGPLLMAAFALAAGAGAYYLSKSINTPKDDKK